MKKTFTGEPVENIFPAHVEITVFFGAKVYRIIGTSEQVLETTKMLEQLHPGVAKSAPWDAQFLRIEGQQHIFQLLVLEQV